MIRNESGQFYKCLQSNKTDQVALQFVYTVLAWSIHGFQNHLQDSKKRQLLVIGVTALEKYNIFAMTLSS